MTAARTITSENIALSTAFSKEKVSVNCKKNSPHNRKFTEVLKTQLDTLLENKIPIHLCRNHLRRNMQAIIIIKA